MHAYEGIQSMHNRCASSRDESPSTWLAESLSAKRSLEEV